MAKPECIKKICRWPLYCARLGYCRDKPLADKNSSASALLGLAKDYEKVLIYYIGVDKKSGDDEGANLKSINLHRVREIIKAAEAVGITCK